MSSLSFGTRHHRQKIICGQSCCIPLQMVPVRQAWFPHDLQRFIQLLFRISLYPCPSTEVLLAVARRGRLCYSTSLSCVSCLQTELEECTESLSEMIARPYLRTPRHKIIQTAQLVQRKRHEFVTAIAKGLVPADTSPTQRKKRNKYSLDLDVSN